MANGDVNGRLVNAPLIMHAWVENRGHSDNKLEYEEKYSTFMNRQECVCVPLCMRREVYTLLGVV